MSIVLSTVAVWGVTLLVLLIAGYGISRWLTPPALRRYELWLVPLWGYALLVFVAYYGLNTILTLRTALPMALLLAVAPGAWRLLRPGNVTRLPRAPGVETLIVGAITLLGGVLGIAPLIRAGYLMPIGHGWDIEFYLPLAAYLQDFSYRTLAAAPPAPLLTVIQAEPTSVRAIGFSYLQGMIDLLGGWSPVGTFAPLLALLRAYAVIPVYLLLRVGLRASIAGAAFGALLVATNELLLWISFNNFAMHVSSMPLVPLAVLMTLLALRAGVGGWGLEVRNEEQGATDSSPSPTPSPQPPAPSLSIAGAIAATTALTLSYHPALLAYSALAAGLGVWALIVNRDRLGTIGRGGAIIVGCLALGGLAHWRAPVAFFDVYAQQTPSIGGERFARLTELLGVEAFHHLPLRLDQPAWVSTLGWSAAGVIVLGIAAALVRGAIARGPAIGLLLFALLYALGLRLVIAFPYGFFKGVSYLSFVPLGIAGVGLAGGWGPGIRDQGSGVGNQRFGSALPRFILHASCFILSSILLAMTAWSTYRLLDTYRAPVLASAEIAALTAQLRGVEDGSVLLVDHPELRGPTLGITSMGLYGQPWIGRGQTGFALFNQPAPGTVATYGLMHTSEDPRSWGFDPDEVVARGGSAVVYRAPGGQTAFLSGNAEAYTRARGSLRQRLNSLEVQNLTRGDYVEARPDAPLTLYAATDRLSWNPIDLPATAGSRRLVLEVASDRPQTLRVRSRDALQTFDLPRGVHRITSDPISMPATLTIDAASPAIVRSAQLFTPETAVADRVLPLADTIAIATDTAVEDATLRTTIEATGADPAALHLQLEVFEISERTPRHYGGGTLAIRANEPAQLAIDLRNVSATLNGGALPVQADEVGDGSYFAALWLYHGADLVRRVPFARFERQNGAIVNVEPLDANATFARLPAPSTPIDAAIGSARITAYDVSSSTPRPGDPLQLRLQWQVENAVGQPLLVFAQILGPDDHKWAAWDGAAGGDWWPSPAWRPGDRLRQDIPLTLDPGTPPGRYRLVVGLYRADTGERLPVGGVAAQNGMIVLQEIEVRQAGKR